MQLTKSTPTRSAFLYCKIFILQSYISCKQEAILLRSYICLRQVILLTLFAVVVRSNTHFAYSLRTYTSTHLFEDGTRGAAATRKRTPSTRICTKLRVRCDFLHQRNEWHNEATPLNVRAVSVALPVGLCRRQKGETREEGGHMLDMFALCLFAVC